MSNQVIIIDKPIGKTPLDMVRIFKEKNSKYKESTISYAGRLDPMAHGLLILLIDEENKNREAYLSLQKTYEVELLFGFETDTYDVLGKGSKVSKIPKVSKAKIEQEVKRFIGKREQVYPPYSSKAVDGKPLFWWARNNKLDQIEIPKRDVEIFSIEFISEKELIGEELLIDIEKRIEKVQGNFRQEEIMDEWRKNIDVHQQYPLVKIQVTCSSGTYMRSLANDLGIILGYSAIAYDIYRTKVGNFFLLS